MPNSCPKRQRSPGDHIGKEGKQKNEGRCALAKKVLGLDAAFHGGQDFQTEWVCWVVLVKERTSEGGEGVQLDKKDLRRRGESRG